MAAAATEDWTGLTGERVRVVRTTPALAVGWGMIAFAVALLVVALVGLAGGGTGRTFDDLGPVALVAAVAAAGWALFLRPAVELRTDGVVLRNVLSDVSVPFAEVAEVTDEWALGVVDRSGGRHEAWAVPVRRQVRPVGEQDRFAQTTRRRADGGFSAQGVADELHRLIARWRDEGAGHGAATTSAGVRRRRAWPAVAALVSAAVLILLGLAF